MVNIMKINTVPLHTRSSVDKLGKGQAMRGEHPLVKDRQQFLFCFFL